MEKKRILVIDDETDFLNLLKIRLEANDYEVVVASGGKEGLEEIKKKKFDAVLLDILMPGIDGFTVLKKIKQLDKKLPVFMITAFSTEERFKMANKLNAAGFIVKTNDLKEEIEHITGALRLSEKYKGK